MTSRDERRARLEAAIASSKAAVVGSVEELDRAESVRFSRTFGTRWPQFRSSISLRFHGSGVQGHDLNGSLAGQVVARLTDAIRVAGTQVKGTAADFDLFLSPTIGLGSTVLELFGRPFEDPQAVTSTPLIDDIRDTPIDGAIRVLLETLESIDVSTPISDLQTRGGRIDGAFGKHLFSLARLLLDGEVDLGLTWVRPSGASRAVEFDRPRARHLRDLLDVETIEVERDEGAGELASISTDGVLTVKLEAPRRLLTIRADNFEQERLRRLWAKRVQIAWRATIESHPQRDSVKTTYELESIVEASGLTEQGTLPVDAPLDDGSGQRS